MSAASMQTMTANMQSLKQAASSGGFAINQAGADEYIKSINQALDELQAMDRDLYYVQQTTKLGTSPDAVMMSQYNLEGATGGAGTSGIIPAVDQLKTALTDARSALETAVKNYRAVDESSMK